MGTERYGARDRGMGGNAERASADPCRLILGVFRRSQRPQLCTAAYHRLSPISGSEVMPYSPRFLDVDGIPGKGGAGSDAPAPLFMGASQSMLAYALYA